MKHAILPSEEVGHHHFMHIRSNIYESGWFSSQNVHHMVQITMRMSRFRNVGINSSLMASGKSIGEVRREDLLPFSHESISDVQHCSVIKAWS